MAETGAEPCFLLQLPTEVILHIGACTPGQQDLSRLCRAHSFLHHTLGSLLYRRDAQEHHASALRWAAKRCHMPTARRSLAASPAMADRQVLHTLVRIHGDQSRRGIQWEALFNLKRPSGRVRDRRDMLCLLLQHGATPEMDLLYVATAVAMQTGDGEMLALLQDRSEALRHKNLEVDWLRSYPLLLAGLFGTPALFNQFLPEVRARLGGDTLDDADLLPREALADIASRAPADMLACLLDNKMMPPDILLDSLDLNVLERVIQFPMPDDEKLAKAKLLLESGLVVWNRRNRITGRTPFATCCVSGTAAVAELLLQRPEIDPNLADYGGQSPYLLAYVHRYEEVFKVLIKSDRIDPVHKAQRSARILAHALSKQDPDTVALLLERGHAGHDYVWILHKAVQEDCPEIIEQLVMHYGVDVDAPDGFGNSPLRFAVQQEKENSVERLLELGADINAVDEDELVLFFTNISANRSRLKRSVADQNRLFRERLFRE